MMPKEVDHVNKKAGAAPDDVFEAIHAVMHLFRSRQYRGLQAGPRDLTHLEAKVLGFFARHPGATQTELVAHSGRDKSQLTRLVSGLKERGLLAAQPDERDRRSSRLQLTPDGRTVQQVLQRQSRRLANAAVSGLSAEERRRLVALLDKVRANLEAAP
jgi:DNA-binding MarR family transcriptional regulator